MASTGPTRATTTPTTRSYPRACRPDSYATTYAKSRAIIGGFSKLGANTVRLPVNPTSVNGPFWKSCRAAIDAATAKGFKVILGYRAPPPAPQMRIGSRIRKAASPGHRGDDGPGS